MLIGGRSCRSCAYVHKFNNVLYCTFNPPQVFVLPLRNAAGELVVDRQGMAVMSPQSTYPQVNPAIPCGKYQRSEANAQSEVEEAAPAPAERIVLNS